MVVKQPQVLVPPFDPGLVPSMPAVFLIHGGQGYPYLSRTASLRRRLERLLAAPDRLSRRLRLGEFAVRIEYWPLRSRLESVLLMYALAKKHYPDDYARRLRLRPPAFVKVLLGNEFPRTQVTTRLAGGRSFYYGPFRSRAAAEAFEQEALDLFQLRRCQEDLSPAPEHPGCIYGEMMKCLRPCQQVVGPAEYGSEAARFVEFLRGGGRTMLEAAAAAREKLSQELNFEQARRQHERYLRIQAALKRRDDLAADVSRLNGVAVCPGEAAGSVDLVFLLGGIWAEPVAFDVAPGGDMTPMDRRLRELICSVRAPAAGIAERHDHLSILAGWFYSSARTEAWVGFESLEELPYRTLVRAISNTARASQAELFPASI